MKTSPETPQAKKNSTLIRGRVARTALALTAAAAVIPSAASANTYKTSISAKERLNAVIKLRNRQATEQLRSGKLLETRNGAVLFRVHESNGGLAANSGNSGGSIFPELPAVTDKALINPIISYAGKLKAQTPSEPLTSGNYLVGRIVERQTGHPSVRFMRFNPDTMKFQQFPDQGYGTEPRVGFPHDASGNVDLSHPFTSPDGLPHGGPYSDQSGNALPVGKVVTPRG